MTEQTVVRVFAPSTFEGVLGTAIIKEMFSHADSNVIQLELNYVSHLDYRKVEHFRGAHITVTLGLPYKGYPLPDEFYTELANPFTELIHLATYGQTIESDYIFSLVDEDEDPIRKLILTFGRLGRESLFYKHAVLTDKVYQLVEALHAYRTWTWEQNGLTRVLLALYHGSYKQLPKLIYQKDLATIIKEQAPIIKGQMEKMDDYIKRKCETAKKRIVTFEGQACELVVVMADDYVNEVASALLSEQTEKGKIICVLRTTRGNDMLSIRTRKVHAGRVAQLINDGSGKEEVASVFTGQKYAEVVGSGLEIALTANMQ